MSSEVSINLYPGDAVVTREFDSIGNEFYKINIPTDSVGGVAAEILKGLSEIDQRKIHPNIRAKILNNVGQSYAYTLPSMIRWVLGAGVPVGIVVKTLSDMDYSSALEGFAGNALLERVTKVISSIPLLTSYVAPLAKKAVETIHNSPHIAVPVLAGAVFATIFVPEKVSVLVSDTVAYTKKVASATVDAVKTVGTPCWNHPRTTLTIATVGLLGWFFRADLETAFKPILKASVQTISKVVTVLTNAFKPSLKASVQTCSDEATKAAIKAVTG